jgi:hypothetical protein
MYTKYTIYPSFSEFVPQIDMLFVSELFAV